jgi:hypothetical protein
MSNCSEAIWKSVVGRGFSLIGDAQLLGILERGGRRPAPVARV